MMSFDNKLHAIGHAKINLKPETSIEILDKATIGQADDQVTEQLKKESSKLFITKILEFIIFYKSL